MEYNKRDKYKKDSPAERKQQNYVPKRNGRPQFLTGEAQVPERHQRVTISSIRQHIQNRNTTNGTTKQK